MSNVGDLLNVAKAFSFKRTSAWIAQASVIWTAWSVLSRFRSVQDVATFLREAAREFDERLGWLIDLVVFALWRIADIFHFIADTLFSWIPVLAIPQQYHEPAIICLLAVVPTCVALARLTRLREATATADKSSVDFLVACMDANASGQSVLRRLGSTIRDDTTWLALHDYRGRDALLLQLRKSMRRSGAAASTFLSLVGFKVFSLRFYVSLVLASALTFEVWYAGLTDFSSLGASGAVWLCVAISGWLGLYTRGHASIHERHNGAVMAHSLAVTCSIPVAARDAGSGPQVTEEAWALQSTWANETAAFRCLVHLLRSTDGRSLLQRLLEAKHIGSELRQFTPSQLVNVRLALWAIFQGPVMLDQAFFGQPMELPLTAKIYGDLPTPDFEQAVRFCQQHHTIQTYGIRLRAIFPDWPL